MKQLVIALMSMVLLTGMIKAHIKRSDPPSKKNSPKEYLIDSSNYMKKHDQCFTDYDKCLLERPSEKKECWTAHEKCVIDVYHEWLKLKKKKGY